MTTEERWTEYGEKHLKGKKIAIVRYMSDEEAEAMGWDNRPLVLQFTDGSLLFASSDDEGNNGGALFGQSKKGEDWTFPVI